MAFDKDFVVKNGLQVNENLIYADSDTENVGIGTTQADKKLVVIGDGEVSSNLSVGNTLSSKDGLFTGIVTAYEGLDVGLGGTFVNIDIPESKIGIGSTTPVYTLDLYGPVSTGTTAAFIFGDVEVTGNVKASALSGQITAGGSVGFTSVIVDKDLTANNAEVFTLFRIEEVDGDKFRFLAGGEPVSIGFTENTDNPTIFVSRGQKYQFDLDSGGFPFYIKTEPTVDLLNQYNDGVEGNGTQVGIVTFKVPFNAPNILFYQASNTSGMGGTIFVANNGEGMSLDRIEAEFGDITNLDVQFLNVTGIATIKNIVSDNFSVSAGIVTANQFVGVSTGSDNIDVNQKDDNTNYKVSFTDDIVDGSKFQKIYIESEDSEFTYNPSTNTLNVNKISAGTINADSINASIEGVSESATSVNLRSRNDSPDTHYVAFGTEPSGIQRLNTDIGLTYQPSTNSLTASNFIGNLSGISTGSNNVKIDEIGANRNFQILFSENQETSYERLYIDSEDSKFIYNPSTNTLFVDNIQAINVTASNINASIEGVSESATSVNLRSRNDSSDTHYVTFGTQTSGIQRLNTDIGLTYQPSTNSLTASNFIGTSDKALKVKVSDSNLDQNFRVIFSNTNGVGDFEELFIDAGGELRYNPNNDTLSSGKFDGNGKNLTDLNASELKNGTVPVKVLPQAQQNTRGIVFISDNENPNSPSSDIAVSQVGTKAILETTKDASRLEKGKVNNKLLNDGNLQQKGIVRLSNAIKSTSETEAATSFALNEVRKLIGAGTPEFPDATLKQKGIVQLSNETNSDVDSKAATPKAVNDLRLRTINADSLTKGTVNNARLNDGNLEQKGIVRLSNATDSTSQTQAATSFAVKLLNDKISGSSFPQGTKMVFYQSSPPTGWSRNDDSIFSNSALRTVTGGNNSGGTGTGGENRKTFSDTFKVRDVPLKQHSHTASSQENDVDHTHNGNTNNGGTHTHGINDPEHFHFIANSEGAIPSLNEKALLNGLTSAGSQGFGGNTEQQEKRDYVLERSASSNADVGRTSKKGTGVSVKTTNSSHQHNYTTGFNNTKHRHNITVNNAGTSEAAMDFSVKYINVIICTKD